MKVLQVFIYKSVKTGLFLKLTTARSIFEFNKIMLVFTFKTKVLKFLSMIILHMTTLVAEIDFKSRPESNQHN